MFYTRTACNSGYYGPMCDSPCPTGTFGKNCGGICAPMCSDQECNPVFGCGKTTIGLDQTRRSGNTN